MPSDTRYVRAATARRSPRARLYSAVPRSSQCPSIVIAHVGYFFRTAAFACSISRPASLTSALSKAKNTGCRGESRFKSSSDRPDTSSLANGGGGIGSRIGAGGSAGRVAVLDEGGGVGGGGRATGGCAFLHPAAPISSTRHRQSSECRLISVSSLFSSTSLAMCCYRRA